MAEVQIQSATSKPSWKESDVGGKTIPPCYVERIAFNYIVCIYIYQLMEPFVSVPNVMMGHDLIWFNMVQRSFLLKKKNNRLRNHGITPTEPLLQSTHFAGECFIPQLSCAKEHPRTTHLVEGKHLHIFLLAAPMPEKRGPFPATHSHSLSLPREWLSSFDRCKGNANQRGICMS